MKVNFNKEQWAQVRKPCVYWFLDKNKNPLYIGFGERGFCRVFSDRELQWHTSRKEAVLNCDSVEVEFFDDKTQAYNRETEEIHKWHPKNQYCSVCTNNSHKSGVDVSHRRTRLDDHLKKARGLVIQFGGIPNCGWLIRNGFSSLDCYMRFRPDIFKDFVRVRICKGDIRWQIKSQATR